MGFNSGLKGLNECFPWVSLVSSKVHHFINCLCLQVHLLFYQALETEVFSNNSFNLLKPITFISQRFSVLPMTQKLLKMGLLIQKISYSCVLQSWRKRINSWPTTRNPHMFPLCACACVCMYVCTYVSLYVTHTMTITASPVPTVSASPGSIWFLCVD